MNGKWTKKKMSKEIIGEIEILLWNDFWLELVNDVLYSYDLPINALTRSKALRRQVQTTISISIKTPVQEHSKGYTL